METRIGIKSESVKSFETIYKIVNKFDLSKKKIEKINNESVICVKKN